MIGIIDVDLHQEAIELRLRQRVGALLLDRVLRREHMEGAGNVVTIAGDGHVVLLHRLQQRGLGTRARAIDLIGHQQLTEDRAGDEPETALAAGTLIQHLAAQDVGRHEIGGELDAAGVEPEHDSHGLDQLGLGEAGKTDQQRVPPAQHGDERLLDHRLLPEDHVADRGLGGGDLRGRRLRLAHDHIFELFQPIAGYRHDLSSLSSIHDLRRLRSNASPSPSDLTKKRATFGPCAYAPVRDFPPESSQLLKITVFFTGCDPASVQVCHNRPRTPAAPIGRECLNSLSFSASALAGQGLSSLQPQPQERTAGHCTSSRQRMADDGRGLHSTHREAAGVCRR